MKSRIHSKLVMGAGLVGALSLILLFTMQSAITDSIAQLLFGAASVWALRSSGILENSSEFPDFGSPSLQSIAKIAPWLVILQLGMGIALRYKYMGAISHVLGAMLVGAFLLYFATGVLAPAPKGHSARTAALALLYVVSAQVLLGIAAYVIRFSDGSSNNILPNTQIFTHLHSATAMLTFGVTLVLCEITRRTARKQEEHETVS
ncbi:hypothetical protein [Bryobacter aggregatus]|uniref:hypothetical protein n=1 Tax=Bryobacter aggregatus TaxID=360054 RepID=UPI0004E0B5A4|nr:hypothetical protein [Bryobacter aggregatus]